jgi:hypothetical protein
VHCQNSETFLRFGTRQPVRLVAQIFVLLALIVAVSAVTHADDLAIGEFSFDELNPGAIDAFTVQNFTGDNNLGFFPVSDNLNFLDINVTFTDPTGPTSNPLGELTPDEGSTQLPVLASDTYLQAVFQATLSQTIFGLSDGTTFQADSNALSLTLAPSSGPSLQAGVDFGIITVSGSVVTAPTPEPPAWLLLFAGTLCIFACKRVSRPAVL